MADRDVLELENAEEFGDGGDMEMGEESISKLKDKAKRRKGRGFEGSAVSRDVSCTFLAIYHLLYTIVLPRMESMRELMKQTRESPGHRGVSRDGFCS